MERLIRYVTRIVAEEWRKANTPTPMVSLTGKEIVTAVRNEQRRNGQRVTV